MKALILSLLIMGLLIFPAGAYTDSSTAPEGEGFEDISFTTSADNSGTIEITQDDGTVTTATWSYTGLLPTTAVLTPTGGDAIELDYYTSGLSIIFNIKGTLNSSGRNVIKMGFGQSIILNKVSEIEVDASPIVSYTITSDNPVSVSASRADIHALQNSLNSSGGEDFLSILRESIAAITSMFLAMLWWLKFLFVDNLLLIFALYFTGTMAYAANTSRNIFVFYKTWFRQQRALFEFMAYGLSLVVSIATNTIQAVLKWI